MSNTVAILNALDKLIFSIIESSDKISAAIERQNEILARIEKDRNDISNLIVSQQILKKKDV